MMSIDENRSTPNLTVIDTDRIGILIEEMEQMRGVEKLDLEIKLQLAKMGSDLWVSGERKD